MDKKYITLKEASKISGYAPDYIGQLIRGGKIPGKQIYCNVAWVTTEADVREYLKQRSEKGSGGGAITNAGLEERLIGEWRKIKIGFMEHLNMLGAVRVLLYTVTIFSCVVIVLGAYIVSTRFEKSAEYNAVKNIDLGGAVDRANPEGL
jgi:hypothetical protein